MTLNIDAATKKVQLARGFTVGDYLTAVDEKNRNAIASGIHRRFTERYLDPVSKPATGLHGFTIMAISCLMIEALESFRRGWPDTSQRGHGEQAFCSFFDAHSDFSLFRGHVRDFYKGVRCGILHQAETALGWRIGRKGALFNIHDGARVINADKFAAALGVALDSYRDQLTVAAWDDEVWVSLRKKMERVCANCLPQKGVV
ncbi:MAG: hypothetical protein Q8P50_13480 [Bacillota bacterium]|nr:hypothetical protein [Bacillota bacterium]